MAKKFGRRNVGGNGRHRPKNCSHFKKISGTKNLGSSHPMYKRLSAMNSTRTIQESQLETKPTSKHNCESDGNDVELQPTSSSSQSSSSSSSESNSVSQSSGGQVSDPRFDLIKSMLKENYYHVGSQSYKVEEIGNTQKENKNMEILEKEEEGDDMETEVVLERVKAGIGKKDLDQDEGRGHMHAMFKDFGGLAQVVERLIHKLVIPLKHPEVFKRQKQMGAVPPTGVLLHGPPGCGKTRLAQAVANEAGVPFYEISATDIVSGVSGQSEKNIRDLFSKASRTSPSIIFIDEIDAIGEKRENLKKGMEERIVTQLLKCMDNIQVHSSPAGQDGSSSVNKLHTASAAPLRNSESTPAHVIVIGATNRPDSLDRALRRPGRFSFEIELGVPDEKARYEILSLLTCNINSQCSLDLRKMARDTHGFVGADLKEYVGEACQIAIQKMTNSKKHDYMKECGTASHDWWNHITYSSEELGTVHPTMADFEDALKQVQPSLKREGFSPIPDVNWENVGGLDNIRQEFQNCIVRPIKCAEDNEDFKDDMQAGFLLYGPPGCGKTLIAKAVAKEAGASFIYIKGPELLNKYVGESELAVRKVFSRARACSPCIVFFDEVDAFTANHGETGGASHTVLKQLLVELDGAEQRRGVYVIGATNRPELVDRALLRPGRFEQLVYVPLPSPEERGLILKALVGNRPIDDSVDLLAIAKSKACEHFSGADLSFLMRKASRIARQEIPMPSCLNVSHFEKALEGITPSVNKKQRRDYKKLSRSLSAVRR